MGKGEGYKYRLRKRLADNVIKDMTGLKEYLALGDLIECLDQMKIASKDFNRLGLLLKKDAATRNAWLKVAAIPITKNTKGAKNAKAKRNTK